MMKIKFWLIALLLAITLFVVPIPLPGDTGAYNTISRKYWCANAQACTHERGHALDQSLGWPSEDPEFAFDVQVYVISEMRSDQPSQLVTVILKAWRHPSSRIGANQNAELYAQIYQATGGDLARIPGNLQQYYGGTN